MQQILLEFSVSTLCNPCFEIATKKWRKWRKIKKNRKNDKNERKKVKKDKKILIMANFKITKRRWQGDFVSYVFTF